MSWGIFFEWIKSALLRKRSAILLSPATNLLSVRFHIVDKYLHSLIISTSFQISRGFLLPDWNLEWFAALFEMFPRTCDVRHVGILFHCFMNSARFRKKCFVFFSFVVRFRLVIRFYSHFFGLLVRFFPNTRFSNRSDCILRVKLSLSPRVIWSFLVVRILLVAHGTLLLFYKLLFVKT